MSNTNKPEWVGLKSSSSSKSSDSDSTLENLEALPEPSLTPIQPDLSAATFSDPTNVDNPYLPFIPGTVYTYSAEFEDDGEIITERNDAFVTFETKMIEGIKTIVVRDTEYEDGVMVEDTIDWYAQDDEGNVWYLGEQSYAFEYDDDGNFIGTSTDGSWIMDGEEVFAGFVMPSPENLATLEDAYYQEYAEGEAEDQAEVISTDTDVETDVGDFDNVLQTFETTQLDPEALEYKYYEPSVGQVLSEGLDEDGEVEETVSLLGIRELGTSTGIGHGKSLFQDHGDTDYKDIVDKHGQDIKGKEQPEMDDFFADDGEMHFTYLGGDSENNNALGAYTFDIETGEIDGAFIVLAETDGVDVGSQLSFDLAEGQGISFFLTPNGGDGGIDLSLYEDGGLDVINFSTGEAANIYDQLSPLFVDSESGTVMPITAFHTLDTSGKDNYNLLNPAGGVHAVELEASNAEGGPNEIEATVIAMEDMFVSDPEFEGDFDDLIFAIGDTVMDAEEIDDLIDILEIDEFALPEPAIEWLEGV
jgi:hypothetical protein